MKKVIIAVAIIVFFITIGVLEQVFLKKLFNEVQEYTEEVRVLCEEKNFEFAHQKTIDMKEKWHKKKHFIETIISHNETKEITLRIAELEGYISASDDKSAIATAAILSDYCHNLLEILAFSYSTIL